MIYAIYMAWSDEMDNDPSDAFGYKVVGYVDSEEEAKSICSRGGMLVEVPLETGYLPVYKYHPIEKFSEKVLQ